MSRRIFWTVVAAFCVGILVTFIGFGVVNQSSAQASYGIMILKTHAEYDFWNLVRRGAQTAAREYEVKLDIWAPENEKQVDDQIELVEQAISEKPDFIVLAVNDKVRLENVCRQVKNAGIGLILMDSGLASSSSKVEDCFVGIRNTEAATHLALQMARSLDGKGEVALLTHSEASTTGSDRVRAIRQALAAYPDIEIVASVACGDDPSSSYTEMKKLLEEYKDLRGVFATNQLCTEGASRALQEVPDTDIAFYAFDTAPSQNTALEEGIADGFIVQQAFNMGYMSVEAGSLYSRNLLRRGTIDPGWVYVTKENMHNDDIQKLIYPFQ